MTFDSEKGKIKREINQLVQTISALIVDLNVITWLSLTLLIFSEQRLSLGKFGAVCDMK